MADSVFTTVYNTAENILNYSLYPFAEGQTFFATDIKKFFKDQNGQRIIQVNFESIEVFDGNINEFYERGTEGFEGEVVISNSPSGFKMYYVDTHGELHPLSFNADDLVNITASGLVSGLDGFNIFVLDFFKLTDADNEDISDLSPPENISGTINFSTLEISNLTYEFLRDGSLIDASDVWKTDIADLQGNWNYNQETSKWEFDGEAIPEDLDATKVKIVVSKVVLFSRNEIYNFSGITGDNPSKLREDGLSGLVLFLFQATQTEDKPQDGSGNPLFPEDELVYNLRNREFEFLGPNDLNGWSLEPPSLDPINNKYVWAIGTAIASNIERTVIRSSEWGTTFANIKLVERYSEDARNVSLTANKPLTITYNAGGSSPNPSGDIIFTATPQNFIDPEYSFNNGVSFTNTNTTTVGIPISFFTPAIDVKVIAREKNNTDIEARSQLSISATRPGQTGPDGKKAVAGIVYFQQVSANAPATPSATSYNISNNSFTGLTQGWGLSSPTFQAGNNNKYWYSRFSGIEGNTPNIVDSLTFTNTESAINFEGLVTFTDTNQPLSLENTNVTSIQGGLLKTAVIESNATYQDGLNLVPRLKVNFDEGTIQAQNFNIDSFGNATFAGQITATSGNIGNWAIEDIGGFNWLKAQTEDNNNFFTAFITNRFLRVAKSSKTGPGEGTSSSIDDEKIRALFFQSNVEIHTDLKYDSLTIDAPFLGSTNFTIENKIGALILKAFIGLTHSDSNPRFLTISDEGILGTSVGSGGGGSGTVTSVSAGNGMNFTTITGSGAVTMGTPSTLTNSTTNSLTATSHTHAITNFALSGTTNQITVTGAARVLGAAATLSLPQNIHTAATPTFGGLTLAGNLIIGTQTNKATLQYTTNIARTFTIPNPGANADFVMTAGSQTLSGLKTFDGEINTKAPNLQDAGGFVAVFQLDPDLTARRLSSRSLADFKSDLGISAAGVNGNVQFNNSGAFGGTNNFHWNNSNNRLGIGTTAPAHSIETVGASGTTLQIRANATAAGTNSVLRFANSTSTTLGNGAVELIATRNLAGGDSNLTIRTAVGATVSDRVRVDELGLTILTIGGTLTKTDGNMLIRAAGSDSNIILNPTDNGGLTRVIGDLEATGIIKNSSWTLIKSSSATGITSTNASSTPSITNLTSAIQANSVIALEISGTTSDHQKSIAIVRLGEFQTTTGLGLASWEDLNSSSTGNARQWSMLVRQLSTTSLSFRYIGFHLPTSTTNKTFSTAYVWRIWRIDV